MFEQNDNDVVVFRSPGEMRLARALQYRKRALELGKKADASNDGVEGFRLMGQALSYISLAENEGLLAKLGAGD